MYCALLTARWFFSVPCLSLLCHFVLLVFIVTPLLCLQSLHFYGSACKLYKKSTHINCRFQCPLSIIFCCCWYSYFSSPILILLQHACCVCCDSESAHGTNCRTGPYCHSQRVQKKGGIELEPDTPQLILSSTSCNMILHVSLLKKSDA